MVPLPCIWPCTADAAISMVKPFCEPAGPGPTPTLLLPLLWVP